MNYSIGVDLHKETVVVAVLNDKGEIVDRKTFATKCVNMIKYFFSSYGLQCQVGFESVGFYQWFWEFVKPVVGKLYLADPVGIRAHAGRNQPFKWEVKTAKKKTKVKEESFESWCYQI